MEQRRPEPDIVRPTIDAVLRDATPASIGGSNATGNETNPAPATSGAGLFAGQFVRALTAAGTSVGIPQATQALANMGLGLAGAIRATVFLLDEASGTLVIAGDCPESGVAPIAPGTKIGLVHWPTIAAALQERCPRRVLFGSPALSPSERHLMTGIGAADLLILPFAAEATAGVLLLSARSGGMFDIVDLASLEEASAALDAAMGSARLRALSRRMASSRAALFRVAQAAVPAVDQGVMLADIARAATEAAGCDLCAIYSWQREDDAVGQIAVDAPGFTGSANPLAPRLELSDFPAVRAALTGKTAALLWPGLKGLSPAEQRVVGCEGAESLLLVPMIVHDSTIGVMAFAARRPQAFDSETVEVARAIAAQSGLTIQHAREAERLARQAEEQAALLRVSRAVISGTSLRDVLDQVTATATALESVEWSRIWLWHRSSQQMELISESMAPGRTGYYRRGERYTPAELPGVSRVIESGAARTCLADSAEVSAREAANHAADGAASFSMLPILVGDEPLGVLAFYTSQARRIPEATVQFGQELAEQAAHAIDRARLYRRLRVRAETDGLTGLLNHRAAFETLDEELNRARKDGTSLGIVVVDLDDFKLFNDTHGHLVGDSVLIEIARTLKETVGEGDHVARYGGDEFLVILPGANALAATSVAEQLVERMDGATVEIAGLQLPIRCSIGVATFPRDARTRPELIAFADSSMYAAKELGGGQVGSIQRGTRSLEVSTLGALSGLVRAVDRKDRYTRDHSDLVAEYAVRFGRALQLEPAKIEALELAGQLHDVGKIAVPDSILRKPGHLTPDEEAMIRQHVVFSELMIKGVPHLDDVLAAVSHHHERWDGQGYPNGRTGTEIPLLGRILAFADALAAMTYDRPYRKGRSLQEAVDEIRHGSGTQFDPDLVEPFIRAVTSRTGLLSDAARRSSLRLGTWAEVDEHDHLRGTTGSEREMIYVGG